MESFGETAKVMLIEDSGEWSELSDFRPPESHEYPVLAWLKAGYDNGMETTDLGFVPLGFMRDQRDRIEIFAIGLATGFGIALGAEDGEVERV